MNKPAYQKRLIKSAFELKIGLGDIAKKYIPPYVFHIVMIFDMY